MLTGSRIEKRPELLCTAVNSNGGMKGIKKWLSICMYTGKTISAKVQCNSKKQVSHENNFGFRGILAG